ncbi:hypothetical protein LJC46_01610 [Desulfovibrio sp. OttesenSCG-928-G15]|nr:hypothetical protein [Desulfovibrio sp. OttesenSCG-928-G15]
MWKPAPRSAQTSIPCTLCNRPLLAKRTCHQAYMYCEQCKKEFPLQMHIKQMDSALESFLEAINCDRV